MFNLANIKSNENHVFYRVYDVGRGGGLAKGYRQVREGWRLVRGFGAGTGTGAASTVRVRVRVQVRVRVWVRVRVRSVRSVRCMVTKTPYPYRTRTVPVPYPYRTRTIPVITVPLISHIVLPIKMPIEHCS